MSCPLAHTLSLRVSLQEIHGIVVIGRLVGSLLKHIALAALGLAVLLAPYFLVPARGAELDGPVSAHVVRVIDGDTAQVEAQIWINQRIDVNVRLTGIDAPEIGTHAHCDFERDKADQAKTYLASLIADRDVKLVGIETDKYGGRVDARILLDDGRDVSDLMLKKRLAMAYDGGRKTPWCKG
ncbi:MAG: thermonuclease family protein [Alphaproteobacteria bacterium]